MKISVVIISIFLLPFYWVQPGHGQITERAELRMWQDRQGRPLEAALDYVEDGKVYLILKGGREAVVPLDKLSDRDRSYLKEQAKQGLTFRSQEMPEETRVDSKIEVEGGPTVYRTPHFEFTNDERVSRAFVMEAARVFEGTFQAISALPLGLNLKPPKGHTHFQTSFQTEANFRRLLLESTSMANPENVAGIYITRMKSVFVPYSQLGAKANGSRMTLRKTSDTSTLIHEITHQLMHDWLPLTPMWMAEGLAEYMSAVPYQNGRFEFKNVERGFQQRLAERGRTREISVPGARDFLEMDQAAWSGASEEYSAAMVYVYYFIHLDRPDAPGATPAAYIKLLGEAMSNTQQLLNDYNAAVDSFNSSIKKYNEDVKAYREKVENYKKDVDQYNDKIRKYNQQIQSGVPEAERIKIGDEPAVPTPPEEPRKPEILDAQKMDGPIDIYAITNQNAIPALLRNRSYKDLEAQMQRSFSEMGLNLRFDLPLKKNSNSGE